MYKLWRQIEQVLLFVFNGGKGGMCNECDLIMREEVISAGKKRQMDGCRKM